MISSLSLERYRGFKSYSLSDLSRVNLLVGKNNCGKTSILEAVYLAASAGSPSALDRIARQRGELLANPDEKAKRSETDVSHFFFSRDLRPGSCAAIRTSPPFGDVSLRIESDPEKLGLFATDDDGQRTYALAVPPSEDGLYLGITAGRHANPDDTIFMFPVTSDGAVSLEKLTRGRSTPWRQGKSPVTFLSQESLQRKAMHTLWDQVLSEGREELVVKALQVLDPEISGVYFLSGGNFSSDDGKAGVLLGLKSEKRRLPLGSFGEGVRRLLALALSLASTPNGIVLIDEIDTGLHYSILGSMWLMVVEASLQQDIQIFATTHSFDCIRGLAWLCENHPELADEVSIQKIEPRLAEAVALHADEITLAVEQGLEVR